MIWGRKFLNRIQIVAMMRIAPQAICYQQRITQQPANALAVFFRPRSSRANVERCILDYHRENRYD